MNELAQLIIGAFLGILAVLMLLAAAAIAYLAHTVHKSLLETRALTARAIARNTAATQKLQTEVQVALTSMDAERLHSASQSIQRGVKQFSQAVATLQRLVFAAGGDTTAIDQAASAAGLSAAGYGAMQNPLDPPGFTSDMSDEYIEPEQQDWRPPKEYIGGDGAVVRQTDARQAGWGGLSPATGPAPAVFEAWAKRHNPEPLPQVIAPLPDLGEGFEQDAMDKANVGVTGVELPDV